jgi:hypothetical protein
VVNRAAAGAVMVFSLIGGFASVLALMYTFTIGHHHLWVGALGLLGLLVFLAMFRSSDRRFGAGRIGTVQQRPRLGRADEMKRRD